VWVPPSTATGNCTWPQWSRLPSDSLVVHGYGSCCRSHCCDLQTGVMVSGDVEHVATSAKRRSDGSVLGMAAMVAGADRIGTRFSSVGSANRAKCAKSAKCDPGRVGSCFLLLGLRSVRILRTVVCQVVGLIPQFAKFAGFARQTEPAAPGAELAELAQFAVLAVLAVFAELAVGAGGTSE